VLNRVAAVFERTGPERRAVGTVAKTLLFFAMVSRDRFESAAMKWRDVVQSWRDYR
jgi:hypothetical protein